jgi:hypothetical protein
MHRSPRDDISVTVACGDRGAMIVRDPRSGGAAVDRTADMTSRAVVR